jgi:hypothetical protein
LLLVLGERCVPRAEYGRVQKREAVDGDLFDEVRPQHDATADVVPDQSGRVETPVVDEFGQGVGLLSDRRGGSRCGPGVAEAK